MKYTVTILLAAGTYEEITLDVPIDPEQDWADFLSNRTVRDALLHWTNYTVIDIDPHIDFKHHNEEIEK